ncbi:MAG: hypothetical protein IJ274_08320 [Lachnospiraceae bacterium]|nr:hypothetical protein [Lachnospiraceae bacterium]
MVVGIILVVVIVAVMVWAIMYDKKKSGQFDEEVDKLFADKKVYGNEVIFITQDNELVARYHSGGVSGYKLFKLDDVKYVMSCWDSTSKCWQIGLYNEKKKSIPGEDHKSSKKKPLKTKAIFRGKSEDVEFLEMIMKFAPNAELVGLYFKEYKGGLKK